jgi:hypothetical protein
MRFRGGDDGHLKGNGMLGREGMFCCLYDEVKHYL